MSDDYLIYPKLRRRLVGYEKKRLMREKRSEEMEALEGVFDRPTMMTVYKMLSSGPLTKIFGAIRSGKESKIYWALGRDGSILAVKIYLTASAEFRRGGRMVYVQNDLRFGATKRTPRSLVQAWAMKEYMNLKRSEIHGVRVPSPVKVQENVLVMKFIGRNGVPAPLLREVTLNNPTATYERIVRIVKRLYQKAGLVHGDLSEYNVMMLGSAPVLFDLAQAVTLEHPIARFLLTRDLTNLNNYFRKLGVKVISEGSLLKMIAGETT